MAKRHQPPAAEPATSAKILAGALASKLDAAHLAIERINSVLQVAMTVLTDQDSGIDMAVVTVLENARDTEVFVAEQRLKEALELLSEVGHG
jgi:hypothetical protein